VRAVDKEELDIDLFREIYESLIPRDIRKIIGEYYTPFWLCEYVVRSVKADDIVIDPFCGSGSFLISAFYRKVKLGRDPDRAFREVVGFDINPIAVSTARANLILAYFHAKGKIKEVKYPFVFLGDFATGFIPPEFHELARLSSAISKLYCPNLKITLDDIPLLKRAVDKYLRREKSKLKEVLKKLGAEDAYDTLTRAIDRLVERYGDGVWSSIITSAFARYIVIKPSIIVTNPPWGLLSAVHSKYGDRLRDSIRSYTTRITAADVSHAMVSHLLKRFPDIRHIYVMPAPQTYEPTSVHGLGKNIIRRMLKKKKWFAKYINVDVFRHGVFPTLLYINFEGKFKIINVKNAQKKKHLDEVEIEENEVEYLEDKYEDFMKNNKIKGLHAEGQYITGIFGIEKYPGLSYDIIYTSEDMNKATIRISNTNKDIVVDLDRLRNNTVEIVYMADVFPFLLRKKIKLLEKEYALSL